jgi:signal transduction histidine kinase
VASPRFPATGEPRSTWFTVFLVVVLVGWTVQSLLAAVGLWSAGRGQPTVVRRRMQALSLGAVVLALALVTSSGSEDAATSVQAGTTLLGVGGLALLVLAFVVPPWLAAARRAPDLVRLATPERGLMAAVTPEEVAAAIVPALVQLFGAAGAALLDTRGRPTAALGTDEAALAEVHAELTAYTGDAVVVRTDDGGFACRLSEGWLVVRPGPFAPVFGEPELHLLDRVGSFVDLALQRCRLFEEHARARRTTEATNTELQTLIYSVSHDLRNPIISVLGYLDVLAREHAGELSGDGEHYLQRISVNALYMQSLIQDLLELSRIGRSEPPSQAVPLGDLAESVAQELRALHPDCSITVEGSFPVVWMSELRARQLLTNVMDNAVKYGGDGGTVSVRAEDTASQVAVLTVTDAGRGVPEHLRDKAFDVFERLDAAQTQVPGTGMGLPICKRIVETLEGTISLGGAPGGASAGTTVTIELPRTRVLGWRAPDVRVHEGA